MLQVDWQQEANRARSLFLAAHKGAHIDTLLQRASVNLDLEAPRGSASSLEAVPEQASVSGTAVVVIQLDNPLGSLRNLCGMPGLHV